MASISDIRNGLHFQLEGELYTVLSFQHVNLGRTGGTFVRAKLKNLRTGMVQEKSLKQGVKFEIVRLERRSMQYLYRDVNHFVLMDQRSYEQILLPVKIFGDSSRFLKEAMEVSVLFAGEEAVGVELPTFGEFKVMETDPGVKGDTASGGTKPAKLETGAIVTVPLFIQEGETIRIDTRTGEYIERV